MENIKLCEYGCGNKANFQLKNGKWCCCENAVSCDYIRKQNSEKLKLAYKNGKRTKKGFSKEESNKGRETYKKQKHQFFLEHPLNFFNSESLRFNLEFSGRPYKCEICGISEWNGSSLTLEIDHIDGIRNHNYPNNLRFLCPNCHSQTETWRGRNINSGETKVSDDELIKALKECKNIRQALIKVGLAPKGANYTKAAKLLAIMQKD